jgi:hypothetical protein
MSNPRRICISNDADEITHQCMSFREATSIYPRLGPLDEKLQIWFEHFYNGFPRSTRIWYSNTDFSSYELPIDLRLDEINSDNKSRDIFISVVSPCILSTGISTGRYSEVSYEFYHLMVAARQLGYGQLPIGLYFLRKIQTRGIVISTLLFDRLLNLEGPILRSPADIDIHPMRSRLFD